MRCRSVLAGVAAVAALALSAGVAIAAPVTGQISMGGYAQAVGAVGMGASTGINFANASGTTVTGSSGSLNSYGAGSGSFAALGACFSATTGCGTIKNIPSFATSAPISAFLTLNSGGPSVSFDLTSISNVTHTADGSGGSVSMTANGTVNFSGYDPTPATFVLAAQGNNIVSFSATLLTSAPPPPPAIVPTLQPALIAVLAGLLVAFGLTMRRRKAA